MRRTQFLFIAVTYLSLMALSGQALAKKQSPLMIAACGGDVTTMKLHLSNGADINEKASDWSPLSCSIYSCKNSPGHVEAAKVLIENGANVNAIDIWQLTPLYYAIAYNCDSEIIKMLLDKGAEPNIPALGAYSPLYYAAANNELETVKILLAKGASPNVPGPDGYTPLFQIATTDEVELAKLLIDSGAKINIAAENGLTPLGIAGTKGKVEMIKLLIARGADTIIALHGLEKYGNKKKFGLFRSGKAVEEASLGKLYIDKYATRKDVIIPEIKPAAKSTSMYAETSMDVDALPDVQIKLNHKAYAIIIGIENYRKKLPLANHAASDARTMNAYLTRVLGFPEENVVTLINDQALKSDFEKYFEQWLKNNVEKGGKVFVYFSGHGAPNPRSGDAFLVPYDGDPSFIDQTGYSLKHLYEALGKLPAKEVVVVLDSCFSGAGGRSVLAEGARPLVMNLVKKGTTIPKNMAVLTASAGNQISSTYKEKGHGLLTYFLLKGIKEALVEDKSSTIEVGELYQGLKSNVERIARKKSNNEQSPQLLLGAEKLKRMRLY